jgi:hypothetical protein
MRTTLFVTLVFASSLALWAQDKVQPVQPMDVKAGLWEVTKTTATSGQIPAALLGKLTPEQRAKFEERMNARSGQSAKPITYKSCVTQDKINKGFSFAEDRNSCTSTVISSTKSKEEVKLECAQNGMKFNGTAHLEAIDSENVKAKMEVAGTDGDRTMNSNSTFTAKWISADCGTTAN